MKDSPDIDSLLDDVLSEGSPAGLRGSLLGETLRLVRSRRRLRRARNISASVALTAICAMAGYRGTRVGQGKPSYPTRPFVLVRTQQLPADTQVATRPLDPKAMIASRSTAVAVHTFRNAFRSINDRELLALASPRAAVLIRSGGNSEELKFINAEFGEADSARPSRH